MKQNNEEFLTTILIKNTNGVQKSSINDSHNPLIIPNLISQCIFISIKYRHRSFSHRQIIRIHYLYRTSSLQPTLAHKKSRLLSFVCILQSTSVYTNNIIIAREDIIYHSTNIIFNAS